MIHIFCALPCEAQPLIQHFKLTELKRFNLFRMYQSKDKEISLTITGIAKLNTASAISYHHACINTESSDVWLNIGIAGHQKLNIGEARLANKIIDEQNNSTWYPQIIFKALCKSTTLKSLDTPSTSYENCMFDMEASAFYQMALRLGTAELIHCFKVVSDNIEQPARKINTDNVKKLIASHFHTIDHIIASLKPLSEEINCIYAKPEYYHRFIERWHFTQSEKRQLSRLLRQWSVLSIRENINEWLADAKSGKTVLTLLRDKISQTEFVLYD